MYGMYGECRSSFYITVMTMNSLSVVVAVVVNCPRSEGWSRYE